MITIIFILLIATAFAYYMHQRVKRRREEEHERRMERFENLMELLKKQKSDKDYEKKVKSR
jgi:preprotein translocase subunit YajC